MPPRPVHPAWIFLSLLVVLGTARADDLLSYDFEAGADLARYDRLSFDRGVDARIAEPGMGDAGACLQMGNREPARYANLTLRGPFTMVRNLTVAFDVKAASEVPDAGQYVGFLAYEGDKQFFGQAPFDGQWHHVEAAIAGLHPTNGGTLRLGQVFDRITIYGRAKNDHDSRMTVWLDNLHLFAAPPASRLSDQVRTSYANPPFLDWRADGTPQQLALSRDPAFPEGATQTFAVQHAWFTPPKPLEPGTWYWKVLATGELADGWSETRRVVIPPETHSFQPRPLPLAELAGRPHPRLVDVAAERGKLDAAGLAALVKQAENEHRQGIADDCPIWVEGDPRWPTWIDWYGKAHGGITSAAGTRLARIGRICALTGDPQVIAWTRELALKAARWDPEGGSNYRRGDIGAHHFLRGLNWCYDALYVHLDETDRTTLRTALVARAEQFWKALAPFPGGENNNHAWLKAFGLAESGLVLNGELPESADWAEFIHELYLGRFLCTLGFQGDNNEGIAYWGYGLSFIIDYADMIKRVAGIDLFQHPWLAQTDRFPLYTAPPNAWAVSFADTGQPNHGVRGPAVSGHVRALAERVGDPYGLWYGGAREPVNGVGPRPPVDLPQSIWYRHIGWVLFNTSLVDGREGVTVAMRSGPFWAGHQHSDLNSFVLHAYGEKLAVDSGHYDWYGSPHFNQWSTLTKAHNTVLVDGLDQNSRRDGADGSINAYFDSPAYGYTVGTIANPKVYDGHLERFDRRILFIQPGYVVVHDLLTASGDSARWDWLLHTVAPIDVDPVKHGFSLTSGAASLAGRFLAPADLQISVVDKFPVEPVDRYSTRPLPPERYVKEWHLTATPTATPKRQEFLTVLHVGRGAPALDAEPLKSANGYGARLRDGTGTWRVASRTRDAAGLLSVDGLRTDGVAACAGTGANGKLRSAALLGGRSLADGGRILIETDRTCDAGLLVAPEGTLVSSSSATPVRLTVACDAPPHGALLDGKPVQTLYNAADRSLRCSLPAGRHELCFGAQEALVGSRPLDDLKLDLPGGPAALHGYARRQADGLSVSYWGGFELAQPGRYRVEVPGVTASLDGSTSSDPRGPWLTAGRHALTVTASAPLAGLRLAASQDRLRQAERLAEGWSPAANDLLLEAEKPTAEGEVHGQVMEKVGASGGRAHCVWDRVGQWAEWDFTVARAGVYELCLRGCGEVDDVVRELSLDGKPLFADGGAVQLGATGGWSRTHDDWRWFRVPGSVKLTPGRHRLRMEQLGGSWNLDCFAWRGTG